eukprot:411408_1
MSIIITLFILFITAYVIMHFSTICTEMSEEPHSVSTYFKCSSSLSLIFASLNAVFNTAYCLLLVFDPQHDDLVFYTQHSSHIQRITSTVSWYISKVALVWLINGRLYFVFEGKILSELQTNKKLFMFINIITTIMMPIFLSVAYLFVYAKHLIYAEIAFNSYRLFLILTIICILYMFSRRLLYLSILHEMEELKSNTTIRSNSFPTPTVSQINIEVEVPKSKSVTDVNKPQMNSLPSTSHLQPKPSIQSVGGLYFIHLTTRNAVLVFTVAISILCVILSFMSFRFLIGAQTRITLLLPMNVAAADSLITSVAVLCLFHFGDGIYPKICKLSNVCFESVCFGFAKRILVNKGQ